MRFRGEIDVAAPRAVTWSALADIASHVEWMVDAESITFVTDQRSGVGTAFDCVTRVGPLRTTDKMTVTEWDDGRRMGVSHNGVVRGSGVFELTDSGPGATRLAWTEDLRFPRYLGGNLTAWVAKPVLRRIWRGNLRRFAQRTASAYLSS
ncbi:MAG TPA: SRPBCC family protein [Acidimicrobiales bacterium]|nr:SRPBCC family protein [Acidimicrobiales bacterium]